MRSGNLQFPEVQPPTSSCSPWSSRSVVVVNMVITVGRTGQDRTGQDKNNTQTWLSRKLVTGSFCNSCDVLYWCHSRTYSYIIFVIFRFSVPKSMYIAHTTKRICLFTKQFHKKLVCKTNWWFCIQGMNSNLKTNVRTTYGILTRCNRASKLHWGFQNGDSYKRSLLCLKRLFVVLGNPRDFGSTSWKPDSGVALAFFLLCV